MVGLLDNLVGEQAQKISKQIDERINRFENEVTSKLDKIDAKLDRLIKIMERNVR